MLHLRPGVSVAAAATDVGPQQQYLHWSAAANLERYEQGMVTFEMEGHPSLQAGWPSAV